MRTLTRSEREYYARKAQEELALMNQDLASIQKLTTVSARAILQDIAKKIGILVDELIEILRPFVDLRK
jgi:hypothetical protein